MSKGIIVVDIPSDCGCCILKDLVDYCINGKNVVEYSYRNNKPKWCPIKEIPARLEELKSPHNMSDYKQKGFSEGWNACLDKLLGGNGRKQQGMKAIIHFSENDIKKIMQTYIHSIMASSVVKKEDIIFKFEKECRGYGTAEHEEIVFKGCDVNINSGKE